CVVDDVPLAASPRNREQVMVEDEDAQVGGRGELLLDPGVPPTTDLAVVEVGLARVDGDDGHAVPMENRVALAEQLFEVDVADVARVVVSGDDDDRAARERVEVTLGLRVFLLEPEAGQVTGADDDVRPQVVDLADRTLEQVRNEVRTPAMQVGDVRDR